MDIIISFFITLMGIGVAMLGLDKAFADKVPLFCNSDPEETFVSKEITKIEKVIVLCVVSLLCFAAAMKIFERVSGTIGILKMLVCLLCLLGAACFDYREHRIPNVFPATLTIAAVVLLGAGVLSGQEGAVAYITTGVVAAVICGLILAVAAVITKQGIGAGDIKLICAVALIAGVYTVVGILFFGSILCSIFAGVVLLFKKKSIGSAVPFGPFLLFGYMLTLFLINF